MVPEAFSLTGQVAIVTGASRGIGAAVAAALASAGAQVVGLGRSDAPDAPGKSDYRSCDVTDSAAFSQVVAEVARTYGQLHVLVNAAGITLPAGGTQRPSDVFRQTLACNLTAIFECCTAVLPHLVRARGGSIINVTSIGAHLGFPGNPGYVAAKAGLTGLTRALAIDFGTQSVRVNNIVPGYIHTAMTDSSYQDVERRQARASRTILGRWGEPEELGGAAVFLASSASSYVTGTDLVVDGGWLAKGL